MTCIPQTTLVPLRGTSPPHLRRGVFGLVTPLWICIVMFKNVVRATTVAELQSMMLCFILFLYFSISVSAQDATQAALQQHAEAAGKAMQRLDYATAEREYLAILQLAPKVAELRSNLGLAYYLQGKHGPAAEQFRQALELKPSLYAPNYFLARIYDKQRKFREAQRLLERALTLQPENREARRQMAATYVSLKEFHQAIELYRSCLKKDPQDMETLSDLGIVYMNLAKQAFDQVAKLPDSAFSSLIKASHYANLVEWGQSEQAEWKEYAGNEYRRAIEKAPHLPEIRAKLGELELQEGNWESAAALFEQELRLEPSSYSGRYGLAQVFFHRQDLEMTLRHLNEAARIRPEFFDPLPAFKIALPEGQLTVLRSKILENAVDPNFGNTFLQAVVAAKLGDAPGEAAAVREAKQDLVGLRDQVTAATRIAQTSAEQVKQEGLQLLDRKRYEAGTTLILPLARKADVTRELLLPVARVLLLMKNYDVATEILDPYANRHQDDPEPYFLLGLGYQNAANQIMQTMIETDAQSYRLRMLMGDAFFAHERYEDAAKEYQAALHLKPGNSDLHFRLGNAYQRQMKYAEAFDHFRLCVESDPNNPQAHLKLGDSLLMERKPEQAVSHLRAALELDSSLIEAHAKLGKALAMLNRFEDAVRELELATELDRDGSLYYQLGTFYRRLGQEKRAATAFKESQRLRVQQLKKQESQTMEGNQDRADENHEIER